MDRITLATILLLQRRLIGTRVWQLMGALEKMSGASSVIQHPDSGAEREEKRSLKFQITEASLPVRAHLMFIHPTLKNAKKILVYRTSPILSSPWICPAFRFLSQCPIHQ